MHGVLSGLQPLALIFDCADTELADAVMRERGIDYCKVANSDYNSLRW